MSACEKCWRDAHKGPETCVAYEYLRLILGRNPHPCLPEEQAGPDATWCDVCERNTRHQYTQECMNCGSQPWDIKYGVCGDDS